MRCDASSWLCGGHVSVATTAPTATTASASSSFLCKTTVSCCTAAPKGSSSSSSSSTGYETSRPWYKQEQYSHAPPDVVRHWIQAENQQMASRDRFSVASYNILGDRNAFWHRDMYRNVPSKYLKWDHRRRVICDELAGWNPDIMCLQEVDKYFELSEILAKVGYVGSYKRRTGGSVDGCAIFWKPDNFRLLEEENIEFKGYGLGDNVAQLSVFETQKAESRNVVIGNIHVLYNPTRGEAKLGQIRFLISRAKILSERWGNAPVVLCGDFNITPKSAIYKFLSKSELNIMLYDRRELSGQRDCHPAKVLGAKQEISSPLTMIDGLLKHCWTDEEIRVATGDADSHLVVHPMKLNSSYATVQGSTRTRDPNGEPAATTYHSKFLGTVDYLWYSDGLVPTRVIDTVPVDVLQKIGSLPCKKVGSDHLALVTEFAFKPGTNEDNKETAASSSRTAFSKL
ncbi:hypothetical protein ACFX1W_039525 [Malus domestica]